LEIEDRAVRQDQRDRRVMWVHLENKGQKAIQEQWVIQEHWDPQDLQVDLVLAAQLVRLASKENRALLASEAQQGPRASLVQWAVKGLLGLWDLLAHLVRSGLWEQQEQWGPLVLWGQRENPEQLELLVQSGHAVLLVSKALLGLWDLLELLEPPVNGAIKAQLEMWGPEATRGKLVTVALLDKWAFKAPKVREEILERQVQQVRQDPKAREVLTGRLERLAREETLAHKAIWGHRAQRDLLVILPHSILCWVKETARLKPPTRG